MNSARDRRGRLKRGGAVTVLLVVAVGIGLVGLTPATAGNSQAPFEAHISGTPTWTGPTTVETHGAGIATHVGRVVNSGEILLSAPTAGCPGGALGLPNVHTETLTAVNGDQLVVGIVGFACQTGPDAYEGTGTWSVIGGTGRFEGTTGRGTLVGRADFAAGECEFALVGTISRP